MKDFVKSVSVIENNGSKYGKKCRVEFQNGKYVDLHLFASGKGRMENGKWFANFLPTVESVQNAINYTVATSYALGAR